MIPDERPEPPAPRRPVVWYCAAGLVTRGPMVRPAAGGTVIVSLVPHRGRLDRPLREAWPE